MSVCCRDSSYYAFFHPLSSRSSFVMAATDHLHRRMAKMSERIRQLEDALSIIHKRTSSDPHPLLRDEFLSIKAHKADESPDERRDGGGGNGNGSEGAANTTDVIDAFGTLSITDRGTSRFFGAAGGTEVGVLV